MINIYKIKIESYSAYYGKTNQSETNVIKETEVNEFKNWIQNIPYLKELPENKKVFFHKGVIFPKRKFAKDHPKNKIVNSADKADIIILDKQNAIKPLSIYYNDYLPCKDANTYCYHYNKSANVIPGAATVRFRSYYNEVEIKELNELITDKQYIEIDSIVLKSTEDLKSDAYDRIDKMLGGAQPDLVKLGLSLMVAYDYSNENNKISIVMLLRKNWNNISRMTKITGIEIKSLIRKVEIDFPSWKGGNDIIFYCNMWYKHRKVDIVDHAFHNFIKTYIPLKEGEKLKIYETTDTV